MVGLRTLIFRVIAAGLLCGSAPAFAEQSPSAASPTPSPTLAPALVSSTPLPAAPAVDAYYTARSNAPLWFRDATTAEAARLLPAILRRAPLDGLANGPELARLVEAAIARTQVVASNAKAGGFLAEERLVSAAWVQYVRTLKAPVPAISWGDPALAPQLPRPDRILFEASKAPSLLQHVQAVAAVNPLYAPLRDAAWKAMERGALAPDPRLLANLERARVLPSAGRYLIANAATAQLWLYEDGRVVDTMKIIVGKRDTPTPMLAGTIHYVTFNPYWNIPTDVTRRVVAPLVVKRGVSYLRAARYELASDWTDKATVVDPATVDWKAVAAGTAEVRLRQLPGANNMMGAIKFAFANDHGIYLHDTPHKGLFAKPKRNFSLGCVRVEDATRLGRWLLRREPVAPSSAPEQHVKLDQGVPIYITYLTAQPGADGGAPTYIADTYGLDPKAEPALEEIKLATAPETKALSTTSSSASAAASSTDR
jgi:murein L,D-transpeptidase YcbB/YkuD